MAAKRIQAPQRGVVLSIHSGTEMLRTTLRRADLHGAIPSDDDRDSRGMSAKARFESNYAERLALLESNRRSHPDQTFALELARRAVHHAHTNMQYVEADGQTLPLSMYMRESRVAPYHVDRREFSATDAPSIVVPYRGHVYQDAGIRPLIDLLAGRGSITTAAAQALTWVYQAMGASTEGILKGHNIVVMGGNAELSPVDLLLKLGANVLVIDLKSPKVLNRDTSGYRGQLSWADGANLLDHPDQVAKTISAFADRYGSLDILSLAYAGGENREWRLMAAQNAIIGALDSGSVRSIGTFVSPSVPALMTEADFKASRSRYEADWFRRAVGSIASGLAVPNTVAPKNLHELVMRGSARFAPIANATEVSQGGSYMGAQLVEKIYQSELMLSVGHFGHPLIVSANTAGITHTRSMDELRYRIGFAGAQALGIDIFDPEFTANMNGLLYVHDIVNPEYDVAIRNDPDLLWARQIHGGIYNQPFALSSMFKWAIGAAVPHIPSAYAPKYPR